jgi:hypothetical protein
MKMVTFCSVILIILIQDISGTFVLAKELALADE